MKNEEILCKAIEKAVENGFGSKQWKNEVVDNKLYLEWLEDGTYYGTIFSHSFAKAFWGEEKTQVMNDWGGYNFRIKWQHCLQTMVLEKEPLLYLKKFL